MLGNVEVWQLLSPAPFYIQGNSTLAALRKLGKQGHGRTIQVEGSLQDELLMWLQLGAANPWSMGRHGSVRSILWWKQELALG